MSGQSWCLHGKIVYTLGQAKAEKQLGKVMCDLPKVASLGAGRAKIEATVLTPFHTTLSFLSLLHLTAMTLTFITHHHLPCVIFILERLEIGMSNVKSVVVPQTTMISHHIKLATNNSQEVCETWKTCETRHMCMGYFVLFVLLRETDFSCLASHGRSGDCARDKGIFSCDDG